MTILYKCTILAAKDPKGDYHRHYVEIESEYCIPTNRLKTMVAEKLPLGYICFKDLTIDAERK